jgi:hypothetical protein
MLFAVGIIVFGLVMQAGFALVNLLRGALVTKFSKLPQSQA